MSTYFHYVARRDALRPPVSRPKVVLGFVSLVLIGCATAEPISVMPQARAAVEVIESKPSVGKPEEGEEAEEGREKDREEEIGVDCGQGEG